MTIPAIPWKRLVIFGAGTLVAFLIFLRSVTSIEKLSDVLRHANGTLILFAVLIILPTPLLSTLRWYAILRAAGHSFSFWRIARITVASMSFLAIPGRLGDFIRAVPLRQEIQVSRVIATIVLEKIFDIAILWWFAAIGFFTLGKPLIAIGAFLAGIAIFALALLGSRLARRAPAGKILEKLAIAGQVFHDTRTRPLWLGAALTASAFNWGTSVFSTWFVFQAFGSAIPLGALFAYLPLVIFAGLIPFGIAGTGTRDSAFLLTFTQYASTSVVLASSIVFTALSYLLFTGIGILFLRHLRSRSPKAL